MVVWEERLKKLAYVFTESQPDFEWIKEILFVSGKFWSLELNSENSPLSSIHVQDTGKPRLFSDQNTWFLTETGGWIKGLSSHLTSEPRLTCWSVLSCFHFAPASASRCQHWHVESVRGHNTLQPLCLLLIPCDHNAYRFLSLLTAIPITTIPFTTDHFTFRSLCLSTSIASVSKNYWPLYLSVQPTFTTLILPLASDLEKFGTET